MSALTLRDENVDRYMAEINRHPLLTREQEQALALRYLEEGDLTAAHTLVVSNLRFVVKVAHEYRGYGFKLLDLIQEGNVGLMLAVKKFDPKKGYRLISYAVWWIRAQIRSYIVRSWSMVKIGTTYAQRKLFFSLRGEKAKSEQASLGESADPAQLAAVLGVQVDDVNEMELRLAARDFSLDAPVDDGARTAHLDMVRDAEPSQEDELIQREQEQLLRGRVAEAMETLNEKERFIVEQRLLNDEPKTLQEIGDTFQVSRERVRQLENRVIQKLRSVFDKDDAQAASAAS